MTDYSALAASLQALIQDVPYPIANLANVSALLMEQLPDVNWVGFYHLEDGNLVLGPFQGRVACVWIPMGKGVCGTAAREDRTLRVPDVHAFPGHIACDSASRSELVIPLHSGGRLWGVLDLDSPLADRFTPRDQVGLETCARVLEDSL